MDVFFQDIAAICSESEFTFTSPRPQCFSLPRPLINYITHHPFSSKGYKKLQQTCKYFFAKNKIIVADDRDFLAQKYSFICRPKNIDGAGAFRLTRKNLSEIPVETYPVIDMSQCFKINNIQFWLTHRLIIEEKLENIRDLIYRCDVHKIAINYGIQILTFKEFDFLLNNNLNNLEEVGMNVSILDDRGCPVTVDVILERIPYVKKIDFSPSSYRRKLSTETSVIETYSTETLKKLNSVKLFNKLEMFWLHIPQISDEFELELLGEFLENNVVPTPEDPPCLLTFAPRISPDRFKTIEEFFKNPRFKPWVGDKIEGSVVLFTEDEFSL